MKSLKIALSALALAAAVATPALRAADETAPAAHKQHGANVEARLTRIDQDAGGLTADQKTKIKDILTSTAEKQRSATPEQRRSIAKEEREAIRAVLTPEQQQKYSAAQKENAGKAKAKGKKKNQE